MQNMSGSQLRESFAFSPRNAVLFCAALLALACALVALAPGQAHAKSYTMPKVDIQAQVETDGALQVTEQRTFDFDGDFSAVWWAFDGLPQNASLKINGVRMANVDADGTVVGDWTTLPSEAFVLGWRESGGPGKDSYSFDAPKNSVYVFFNASDDRRIIELDYTVVNGAQAYSDIGEVYWKYVGSQWKEASDNVTMTLALPVPQGTGRERARMGSWTARRQGDRERRRNRDVCRAACCGRSIRRSARGVSGEVVNEPVARKRGAASRGKPFGHGAERRKGLERPGEPHSRSFVGVRHRLRCCLRAAARLGAARLLQVRTRIPAPVYRRVLARRA